MRAKNLHHGLEFVHQPLVKIAEGKVGAQTYRPAHPDRQALLDASVQLERDHCFGDLQVKEVLARDRRIAGGFQEMNGRIPSIPLGFIEMGMLFPVTRMTIWKCFLETSNVPHAENSCGTKELTDAANNGRWSCR